MFILFGSYILAQDVELRHLRLSTNGTFIFHYMIKQSQNPQELYTVQIFTSADEYRHPLEIELNNILAGKIQTVSSLGAEHFT